MRQYKYLLVISAITACYAADPVLINQYQFNTILNSYEVNRVINDINNNSNVSNIQIVYQATASSAAQQIKLSIQQQVSKPIPINMTLNNFTLTYIGYQPSPITVNIFGAVMGNVTGNQVSTSPPTSGSFYGYTTPEKGFYYESSNDDE